MSHVPPPTNWEQLRNQTAEELGNLGLTNYNGRLFLFDDHWWNSIPDGLLVEDVNGTEFEFNKSTTQRVVEYGALQFGVPARDGVIIDEGL
jgi:hypothetical protein